MQSPLANLHLLPLEPPVGGLITELYPVEAHIASLSDVVPPDAQLQPISVDFDLLVRHISPVDSLWPLGLLVLLLGQQIFQGLVFHLVFHSFQVADVELSCCVEVTQFQDAVFGEDVNIHVG